MLVKEINISFTRDEVIAWLQDLPAEQPVHTSDISVCSNCLFANFLQEMFGNPDIEVGYNTASMPYRHDVVYMLPDWVGKSVYTIDRLGEVQDNKKLTAEKAIEILENLDV